MVYFMENPIKIHELGAPLFVETPKSFDHICFAKIDLMQSYKKMFQQRNVLYLLLMAEILHLLIWRTSHLS